jgi:hypothetical protein
MCLSCYENLSLKNLIDQLKPLEDIDHTYDFGIWNSTSLSFVLIMLKDQRLEHYHYILKNIYNIISNDKTKNLKAISNNSILPVFTNEETGEKVNRINLLFNLIEDEINKSK